MSKVHLLTERSVSNLRKKAKKISKTNSISIAQSLHQVSAEIGFSSWKHLISAFKFEAGDKSQIVTLILDLSSPRYADYVEESKSVVNSLGLLNSKYSDLILDQYTELQKIGAISRAVGVDPLRTKNTIHFSLEADQETIELSDELLESVGFYHDHLFEDWIDRNDFILAERGLKGIYRLLSIDTNDFEDVDACLHDTTKKLELFFPLFASVIWINGKTDPRCLELDPEYFPDPSDLPLAIVPVEVWKRNY